MILTSAVKIEFAVRNRLIPLLHGRTMREMITRRSEVNLRRLALMAPQQATAFFKNLSRLERMAIPIGKIIVPSGLEDTQNQDVLRRLSEPGFLYKLIDDNERLDLRLAGYRLRLGTVDSTPQKKLVSLEDYLVWLQEIKEPLKKSREEALLFLFKVVLRFRVELYTQGEAGGSFDRLITLLREFVERFPFETLLDWRKSAELMERAANLLETRNNPAADATLATLTNRLDQLLEGVAARKQRSARHPLDRKVVLNPDKPGTWLVSQTRYKRGFAGIVKREPSTVEVTTADLLTLFEHELDGMRRELLANQNFLDQLDTISLELPSSWDMLQNTYLAFSRFADRKKEKGRFELEAALDVARLGTGQAVQLARELITLVQADLSVRQSVLQRQLAAVASIRDLSLSEIKRIVGEFNGQIASQLADPDILTHPEKLTDIEARLGGFLGTYFKGEMREDWTKLAKSRVYGVKKEMGAINQILDQKMSLMGEIKQIRAEYSQKRDGIIQRLPEDQREGAVRTLRAETLQAVATALRLINALNREAVGKMRKAAQFILAIEQGTVHDASITAVLERFDQLLTSQVSVLSSWGEPLESALRNDALALQLFFRENTR